MKRIGVIGSAQSVRGFGALGMDVFETQDGAEAAEIIRRLAHNDYAVIYITERLFEQCGAEIEKYTDQLQPAIIPIPGVSGNTGIGMELVSRSVERAVGSDILSNE